MKAMKFSVIALAGALVLSACNMSNAAKGGMIGGAAGGAAGTGIGAGIGALVGGKQGAKLGAAIGAGAGVAVGATAGSLIGHKMDKAKKAAAAIAQAETFTDANGLEGVKVTFDNGILFATGKADLKDAAKNSLAKFATDVLNANPDIDVNIYGFASSDGSDATNLTLSENRAKSVANYLKAQKVADKQLKTIKGLGEDPQYLIMVDGKEDQKASRRVEVYLYASEEMIKAAEAEAAKK